VTLVREGIDLLLAVFGGLAWAFAAFALGSRFISPAAGGLLGIGFLLSAAALILAMYLQDSQLRLLARGRCPTCRAAVAFEHRHRRWDPTRSRWLPPATTWDCDACAFSHGEAWACPACPE